MHIFSHGGYKELSNTLSSIKCALNVGFSGVEIDVRLHNNRLILCHDPVDECVNQEFPFLEDGIETIISSGKMVLLDIKGNSFHIETINILKNILKSYDPSKILVSSFNVNYLNELKGVKNKIGLITSNNIKCDYIPDYIDFISTDYTVLNKCLVNNYHDHGLYIYAWTTKNNIGIEKCKKLGVDGIISDYLRT